MGVGRTDWRFRRKDADMRRAECDTLCITDDISRLCDMWWDVGVAFIKLFRKPNYEQKVLVMEIAHGDRSMSVPILSRTPALLRKH